jgi:hypothetical protein
MIELVLVLRGYDLSEFESCQFVWVSDRIVSIIIPRANEVWDVGILESLHDLVCLFVRRCNLSRVYF